MGISKSTLLSLYLFFYLFFSFIFSFLMSFLFFCLSFLLSFFSFVFLFFCLSFLLSFFSFVSFVFLIFSFPFLILSSRAAIIAQAEYAGALHLTTPKNATWKPRTILHSVHTPAHTQGVWEVMQEYHNVKAHELHRTRASQNVLWMWRIVEDMLLKDLKGNHGVQGEVGELERGVRERTIAPSAAAVRLMNKYLKAISKT